MSALATHTFDNQREKEKEKKQPKKKLQQGIESREKAKGKIS
jgi:hypothetical protein